MRPVVAWTSGIAGLIAFQGYDGFMYSVGWLVAYLTVLFVVVVLYIMGGPVIHGFAFVMTVGVVVGTYSSIFIASKSNWLFKSVSSSWAFAPPA